MEIRPAKPGTKTAAAHTDQKGGQFYPQRCFYELKLIGCKLYVTKLPNVQSNKKV